MLTLPDEIRSRIDEAEAEAAHGCGQSDVLFEKRLQAAFAGLLERVSDEFRPLPYRPSCWSAAMSRISSPTRLAPANAA